MWSWFGVVCLSHALSSSLASVLEDSFNVCTQSTTCDSCIAAGPLCAWCGAPDYTYHRCNLDSSHSTHGCPGQYVYNPQSERTILGDLPLSISESEAVNLQPQEVRVSMRPGDTVRFNVTAFVSKNYPVDLYYLVDNTFSMKDDFENLALLSGKLIENMTSQTSNFFLGLGAFNDKPMTPWIFTHFETGEPIALCDTCAIPNVFRNYISIANITQQQFREQLYNIQFSATIDDTEAIIEAMSQVAACQQLIGWRENAKRLLLVSTEAITHFSGDGMFSGLFTPHDGECHTTEAGGYSAWDKMDFPSLETVFYKLKQSRIQTIFAIPQNRKPYFDELAKVLPSSMVAVMANDSKNVIEVVVDSFTRFAKHVQLTFVDQPDDRLSVSFNAFCPGHPVKVGESSCENVDFGSTATFEVVITAPAERSFYSRFKLAQESLEHWASLTVHVDSIAQEGCQCDDPILYPADTTGLACSSNGQRVCGGCVCDNAYSGDQCQCALNSPVNTTACQAPQLGVTLPCNDRGRCYCDGCKCVIPALTPAIVASLGSTPPRVFGQFCQCDNWSCRKSAGLVCGGPQRGLCNGCALNGPACECLPEWTGKACECPSSNDTCLSASGEICNGEGECVCGVCRCHPTSSYRGQTCEQCTNCPSKHCTNNRECVICAHEHIEEILESDDTLELNSTTFVYIEECEEVCRGVNVTIVDEPSDDPDDGQREQCMVEDDEDDCSYVFYYFPLAEPFPRIEIVRKYCGGGLLIGGFWFFFIIAAIIIGVLLIGIAILVVWKIFITINDRREFAAFQASWKMGDFSANENPLFVGPTKTFRNPSHENQTRLRLR